MRTGAWTPIGAAAGDTHLRPVTKLLWHTTEGTMAGALAVYKDRLKVHPHFTYDPTTRDLRQHVDTDRASYSLHTVDRDGVIQVELIGYAAKTHLWPDVYLQNIAVDIVAPVVAAHPGINIDNYPKFYGEDAGFTLATPSARQRITRDAFQKFEGQIGHQHAPAPNDHWDPGKLNVSRIAWHYHQNSDKDTMTPEQEESVNKQLEALTLQVAGIGVSLAERLDNLTAEVDRQGTLLEKTREGIINYRRRMTEWFTTLMQRTEESQL